MQRWLGTLLTRSNLAVSLLVTLLLGYSHMTPAQSLPTAGEDPLPTETAESAADESLVPVPQPEAEEKGMQLSGPVARLPVALDVVVPVREFRVRHLLALAPGHVIESQWGHADDVPVSAGDVRLAWSEFEVIEARLAVRVTRLA
jgi:flagellar motor switch/type III secretory pathway protein FliN